MYKVRALGPRCRASTALSAGHAPQRDAASLGARPGGAARGAEIPLASAQPGLRRDRQPRDAAQAQTTPRTQTHAPKPAPNATADRRRPGPQRACGARLGPFAVCQIRWADPTPLTSTITK